METTILGLGLGSPGLGKLLVPVFLSCYHQYHSRFYPLFLRLPLPITLTAIMFTVVIPINLPSSTTDIVKLIETAITIIMVGSVFRPS